MPVGISLRQNIQKAEMNRLIKEVARLKTEAEAASLRFEEAQEALIKEMEVLGRKTFTAPDLKATVVKRDLIKYDEKGLAKALGAPVWNKIIKKVMDKPKLEKAVEEGLIDVNVVAQYTVVTPSKPHVRFSAPQPEDADE